MFLTLRGCQAHTGGPHLTLTRGVGKVLLVLYFQMSSDGPHLSNPLTVGFGIHRGPGKGPLWIMIANMYTTFVACY